MENYVDLIDAYLNNELSESEVAVLKNRLKTEKNFKAAYEEHLIIVAGIERVKLKTELKKAKYNYIKQKLFKHGAIIILIIALFLSFLFFIQRGKAKNDLRELLNFETEFIQNFETPTDSIIKIVGKKGTQVIINPKDLELESGKSFKNKKLQIDLIELTSKQDLLLANAQTLSNDEWLISGGAFKINLYVGDKILRLKKNRTIDVKFPKNTIEENMQIFYGDRSENGYLNWKPTKIDLINDEPFIIFCRDTLLIDYEQSKMFGIEMRKTLFQIDTIGFLSNREIRKKFPNINLRNNQKDTIIIREVYMPSEVISNQDLADFGIEYSILDKTDLINLINSKYQDSILTVYESKKITARYEKQKAFYESIKISKLGWINIDQYSKIEDKITLSLKNSLGINFNTFTEGAYAKDNMWYETYLIDKEDNTFLNIYSSVLEIPKDKQFTIISCALVDDEFYVTRKSIKSLKDIEVLLNYKKRNKDQIKSLMRL